MYDRHDYRSKLRQLSDSSYKCWDQASIRSCCRRFDILGNLGEFVYVDNLLNDIVTAAGPDIAGCMLLHTWCL